MKQLLIVVDTETNGIPKKGMDSLERAVSLAAEAVELSVGEDGPCFRTLAWTEMLICPKFWSDQTETALSINGLKKEEIEEKGLDAPQAWAKLSGWAEEVASLTEADADQTFWLAYNSKFDRLILSLLMKDAGLDLREPIVWPNWSFGRLRAPEGCVLKAARASLPGRSRYRLVDVWSSLGLPSRGTAHTALADVRMTLDVVRHLVSEKS